MRGADRISRLRLAGYKPADVLIRIAKAPPPQRVPASLRADFDALDDEYPTVYTDGEIPEVADLRFVVGMLVHVVAEPDTDTDEFDRWVDAVAINEPARIGMIGPQGEVAAWAP